MIWPTLPIQEAVECLIDYRGKTPQKTSTGIRLITAKVIKGGRILKEPAEYIAVDDYDNWMRRGLPNQWDVLITTEAPLGELGILRSAQKIALAQRVILLRGKPELLDQKFLFYVMQGDFVQHQLRAKATGATVLGIKQSELRQVEIPMPSLDVQRRIASILSAYDDLIENNTRRIEILEEMARRLYEEWFVHFRFPGHEEVSFKESELGEIPEGWGTEAATDAFKIKYGKTFPKKNLDPIAQYPVFGGGGLIGRCDQFNIDGPTTLITSRGNGSGTVWRASEAGLVTNNAFTVMPTDSKLNIHYGYIAQVMLNAPVMSVVGGAAQPQLTLDGLAGVRVMTPDPKVVGQFSLLVAPLYALVNRLQRKSANLRIQRDLLLPKLVSGEIDVSDISMPNDKKVEAA